MRRIGNGDCLISVLSRVTGSELPGGGWGWGWGGGVQYCLLNASSVHLCSGCAPRLLVGGGVPAEGPLRGGCVCAPCLPGCEHHVHVLSWGSRATALVGGGGPGAWGELGEGGGEPRSAEPPLPRLPRSLETLRAATSARHSAERTRGRRCPGNTGMPGNKSAQRVTCPARTNPGARAEAGQPGPKSASPPPPSRAGCSELITVIAEGQLRCAGARGLRLGLGGWAGPEELSAEAGRAGPSPSCVLEAVPVATVRALIKRLLCTPGVGGEGWRACSGGGEPEPSPGEANLDQINGFDSSYLGS